MTFSLNLLIPSKVIRYSCQSHFSLGLIMHINSETLSRYLCLWSSPWLILKSSLRFYSQVSVSPCDPLGRVFKAILSGSKLVIKQQIKKNSLTAVWRGQRFLTQQHQKNSDALRSVDIMWTLDGLHVNFFHYRILIWNAHGSQWCL